MAERKKTVKASPKTEVPAGPTPVAEVKEKLSALRNPLSMQTKIADFDFIINGKNSSTKISLSPLPMF